MSSNQSNSITRKLAIQQPHKSKLLNASRCTSQEKAAGAGIAVKISINNREHHGG